MLDERIITTAAQPATAPTRPELTLALGDSPLATVGAEWLRTVAGHWRLVELAPGDLLVRQGDAATELYVVLSGTLDVVLGDPGDATGAEHLLGEVGPGETVGEIALLTGGTRTTSVRAGTTAEVLALSGAAFERLLADHPDVARALTAAAALRLRRTSLAAQVVRHLHLDERDALAALEPLVTWEHLPTGEVLFRQGDTADAAYLVLSGRLRVTRTPTQGATTGAPGPSRPAGDVIGEVGMGEIVGELALLDDQPRSATVVAVRDTHLARLPREALDLVVARFPRAVLHMARTVTTRARGVPRRHEDHRSIAVVALDPTPTTRAVLAGLVEALGRLGTTEHLTSGSVDERLGKPGIAQSADDEPGSIRLVPWLHDAEERSRFVLAEADPTLTPWTRRVLRQSDHVLFVASASTAPDLSAVERDARAALPPAAAPRIDLVLVHPATTPRPAGTARWLGRAFDEAHHVRTGSPGDLDRLARIVAGQAVSVVLSGGGAKGFAHIGALRALDELGVPVDLVAGTSIGAVMALGPAMGLTPAELTGRAEARFHRVMDWTLPVTSLLSARRLSAAIRAECEGADIEDLWLGYACVSASLNRGKALVHRQGPLATAVRASISIPGVMPPVPCGDDLLVDGGVVDNLPVRPMRTRNPTGTVIAVDVAPASGRPNRANYGESLSGWKALRLKALRRGYVPMLANTVLGSMLIAATRDRDHVVAQGLADCYVPLDLRPWGPFEFDKVGPIADAGYAQALPLLQEWAGGCGRPWAATTGARP